MAMAYDWTHHTQCNVKTATTVMTAATAKTTTTKTTTTTTTSMTMTTTTTDPQIHNMVGYPCNICVADRP